MSHPPLVLLLALSVGSAGCATESSPSQPHVLLIVVDTLRADRLDRTVDGQPVMPRVSELAARGARFEHAFAHAPWTLPSIASLLTSLHPRQHGAGGRLPRPTGLDSQVMTLTEVLGEGGYATALIGNVAFLDPRFGLTHGFEHVDVESYETNVEVRRAEETTDAALEWADEDEERPRFLMVHYFDPHAVYDPPQPFRRRFGAPIDRETDEVLFGTRPQMMALRRGELSPSQGLVRRLERLYDGEVAYTDYHIGRLLDGLEERGLLKDTLVVLTSDHGEEFLDHGNFEHGHTLYAELLQVPLVLVLPELVEPSRIDGAVRLIDVAPTICDLVGIEPPEQFLGTSLSPLLQAGEGSDRSVLAHGNFWGPPLTSYSAQGFKLIRPPEEGPGGVELYHWRADPTEQHDLAARDPDTLEHLEAQLSRLERAAHQHFTSLGAEVELSAELLRDLEALGYVDSEAPAGADSGGD